KLRLYCRLVEAEIQRQVYEDSGDYEASIGYHALVAQMFTSALLLMRASKLAPDPSFLERLRRMYRMMDKLASPSGQLPNFGDCDDGRVELLLDDLQQMLLLPIPERNSLRMSNLLGVGKCLFGGRHGSTEDAKWYSLTETNGASSSAVNQPQACRQRVAVFPQSGIAIAKTEHAEVLLRTSQSGYKRLGVMHTRTIHLPERKPMAIVQDQLLGTGTHTFEINFQLSPSWKVSSFEKLGSEIRVRIWGGRDLQVGFQGPGNVNGQKEDSSVSMTYGASTPTTQLRFWGEAVFPAILTTTVCWAD